MIDITNLTSLITAFRQETEQGSITPETLGSLLQAIANELKHASSTQDEITIETLQTNLSLLKGIVNEMVSDISHLESVVSSHNSSSASNFNKLTTSISDIEEYVGSLDRNINTLNSRMSQIPVSRGSIYIDTSSISTPIRNYFNYNVSDGYYNIVRSNQLIGRAYVYTFNGFKIVDVIGLCSVTNSSFVYHEHLDHILLRINSKNEIFATGTIETIDLQNQINAINERLDAIT